MSTTKKINQIKKIVTSTYDREYVRPTDWLPLPDISAGEQVFVGLHAVRSNNEFVAITCAGAYYVDWGDGSALEAVGTGVKAVHAYDIDVIDPFSRTLTSRGYKQVIIKVFPQGTANLTSININVKHTQANLAAHTTGWLDIAIQASLLSTLTIGASSPTVYNTMLEQFEFIGVNALTTMSAQFQNCTGLKSVVGMYTGAATTFANMFNTCTQLLTIPVLNTTAGTIFTGMFKNCYELNSIPLIDTAAGTNLVDMFSSCTSLRSVPLLVTSAATTLATMFNGCTQLVEVPLFNTVLCQTFTSMFAGCTSLRTVPLFNTAAGVTFTSMFSGCSNLLSVPALVMTNATTLTTMFSGCTSLSSAPLSGTPVDISYANCMLSATAILAIFAGLKDPVVSKTIVISGNYGTGVATTVATDKGWTVTP